MLIPGRAAPPLAVRTVGGRERRWPDPAVAGSLLLAFTRPVESPHGRDALLALGGAGERLAASGVALLAVVPSAPDPLRRFLRARAPTLEAVADPEGALGRAWGMGRDPWLLYTLRGLQQRQEPLGPALAALRHGGRPRALLVDLLPAEILLDPSGGVRWSRLGCARTAGPALAALEEHLRAGGSSSTG